LFSPGNGGSISEISGKEEMGKWKQIPGEGFFTGIRIDKEGVCGTI